MLLIHYQTHLLRVPRNIFSSFPELVGFEIFNSSITSVSAEDFRGMTNLQLINIQKNRLVSLDGNLFSNTRRLQFIGFAENLIENSGNDLLTGLNQLITVIFLSNTCINRQATTPQQIAEMRSILPALCPPFSATTISTTTSSRPPISGECSADCLAIIESIRQKVFNQEQKIENLSRETANLNQIVAVYEERLKELEKQVREINSNPRTLNDK